MKKNKMKLIPGKPQLMKFVAPAGPLTPEQMGEELKKLVPYFHRLGFTNFLILGYRKPLEAEVKDKKIVGEIPYCFPYFANSFEAASLVHDFGELLKMKNEELYLRGQLPVEETSVGIRRRSAPDTPGVEVEKRPERGQLQGPAPVAAPDPGPAEKQ